MNHEDFFIIVDNALRHQLNTETANALANIAPQDFDWDREMLHGSTLSIASEMLKYAIYFLDDAQSDTFNRDYRKQCGAKLLDTISKNSNYWLTDTWKECITNIIHSGTKNGQEPLIHNFVMTIPSRVWSKVKSSKEAPDIIKQTIITNNVNLLEIMFKNGISPSQKIEINETNEYGGSNLIKNSPLCLSQSVESAKIILSYLNKNNQNPDDDINSAINLFLAARPTRTNSIKNSANGVIVIDYLMDQLLLNKSPEQIKSIQQKWLFSDIHKIKNIDHPGTRKEWLQTLMKKVPKDAMTEWRCEAGLNPLQHLAMCDLSSLVFVLRHCEIENEFNRIDDDGLSLANYAIINGGELDVEMSKNWHSLKNLQHSHTWKAMIEKICSLIEHKNFAFLNKGIPFGIFKHNGMPEFTATSPPKIGSPFGASKLFRLVHPDRQHYDVFVSDIAKAMNDTQERATQKEINTFTEISAAVKNLYLLSNGLACPWDNKNLQYTHTEIQAEMTLIKIINELKNNRLQKDESIYLMNLAMETLSINQYLWTKIQDLRDKNDFFKITLASSNEYIKKIEISGESYALKFNSGIQATSPAAPKNVL